MPWSRTVATMTIMVGTIIYGKTLFKNSSFPKIKRAVALNIVKCVSFGSCAPYTFCSSDCQRLALTDITIWSNLIMCVIGWGKWRYFTPRRDVKCFISELT